MTGVAYPTFTPALTARTGEALIRAAMGESDKMIAKSMHVSPNTSKAFRRNFQYHLNARNTPEAITIGFKTKILRFALWVMSLLLGALLVPTPKVAEVA